MNKECIHEYVVNNASGSEALNNVNNQEKLSIATPIYENELSVFQKETLHKVEEFRAARRNWTTSYQNQAVGAQNHDQEPTFYRGRCSCLRRFKFKNFLRNHRKTVRNFKFYSLRRKLVGPKSYEISSESKENLLGGDKLEPSRKCKKKRFRKSKRKEKSNFKDKISQGKNFFLKNYFKKKNGGRRRKKMKHRGNEHDENLNSKLRPSKRAIAKLKEAKSSEEESHLLTLPKDVHTLDNSSHKKFCVKNSEPKHEHIEYEEESFELTDSFMKLNKPTAVCHKNTTDITNAQPEVLPKDTTDLEHTKPRKICDNCLKLMNQNIEHSDKFACRVKSSIEIYKKRLNKLNTNSTEEKPERHVKVEDKTEPIQDCHESVKLSPIMSHSSKTSLIHNVILGEIVPKKVDEKTPNPSSHTISAKSSSFIVSDSSKKSLEHIVISGDLTPKKIDSETSKSSKVYIESPKPSKEHIQTPKTSKECVLSPKPSKERIRTPKTSKESIKCPKPKKVCKEARKPSKESIKCPKPKKVCKETPKSSKESITCRKPKKVCKETPKSSKESIKCPKPKKVCKETPKSSKESIKCPKPKKVCKEARTPSKESIKCPKPKKVCKETPKSSKESITCRKPKKVCKETPKSSKESITCRKPKKVCKETPKPPKESVKCRKPKKVCKGTPKPSKECMPCPMHKKVCKETPKPSKECIPCPMHKKVCKETPKPSKECIPCPIHKKVCKETPKPSVECVPYPEPEIKHLPYPEPEMVYKEVLKPSEEYIPEIIFKEAHKPPKECILDPKLIEICKGNLKSLKEYIRHANREKVHKGRFPLINENVKSKLRYFCRLGDSSKSNKKEICSKCGLRGMLSEKPCPKCLKLRDEELNILKIHSGMRRKELDSKKIDFEVTKINRGITAKSVHEELLFPEDTLIGSVTTPLFKIYDSLVTQKSLLCPKVKTGSNETVCKVRSQVTDEYLEPNEKGLCDIKSENWGTSYKNVSIRTASCQLHYPSENLSDNKINKKSEDNSCIINSGSEGNTCHLGNSLGMQEKQTDSRRIENSNIKITEGKFDVEGTEVDKKDFVVSLYTNPSSNISSTTLTKEELIKQGRFVEEKVIVEL